MFDEEAMGFTKKIMYKLLHDLVECTVGWRDKDIHTSKQICSTMAEILVVNVQVNNTFN